MLKKNDTNVGSLLNVLTEYISSVFGLLVKQKQN